MSIVVRRCWSVVLGGRAIRISSWDSQGQEHYAVISDEGPVQDRRERRYVAVELIERHIRERREAGQVGIPEEVDDRDQHGRDQGFTGQSDRV